MFSIDSINAPSYYNNNKVTTLTKENCHNKQSLNDVYISLKSPGIQNMINYNSLIYKL